MASTSWDEGWGGLGLLLSGPHPSGTSGAAVTPVILAVLISLQASQSLLGTYPAVDGLGYLGTLQYSKHLTARALFLAWPLTLGVGRLLFLLEGGARGSENPAHLPKAAQLTCETELCEANLSPAHLPGLTG